MSAFAKLSYFANIIPWILLALACNYFIKFILYLDVNKRSYNHVPGNCHSAAAIEDGSEDIEYLGNGWALIASGLRMYDAPELNKTRGKMYLYNFTANSAWELSFNSKKLSKKSFNPHGITTWTAAGKRGKTTVYVINHHPKGDRIEVFLLDKDKKALNHTRTIRSRYYQNLNNIVAVGQDKLFATNMHYFNKTWLRNVEFLFNLKLGSIVFHNGTHTRFVERWVPTPSGVAWDKSKRYLLVSCMFDQSIRVYKINSFTNGSITEVPEAKIELATSPDNLWVESTSGDIYVGTHPIKFRYWLYEGKPKTLMSPSQVLRLSGKVNTKTPMDITQVFASDGATLSASSVAVRFKQQILIGSVHSRLLICNLDSPDFF